MPETLIVGVDGCRAGWVACPSVGPVAVFESFKTLIRHYPKAKFLVDVPQGLTTELERDLERLVRQRLPAHKSSVFSVPCRAAVYAASYEEACLRNAEQCGKKISIQAWNICPKIREVDSALRETSSWRRKIYESHPELCFSELGNGKTLSSKKTPKGQKQRLDILRARQPQLIKAYDEAVRAFPRKLVARDDILDAMVLMVVGVQGFTFLQGEVRKDELGIPIRLAVPV